jgi:cold-inducible RNA-binding protein
MSSSEEADKAIQMFNGYSVDGRDLRVSIARPREERPRGGGGRDRRGGSGGGNRGY